MVDLRRLDNGQGVIEEFGILAYRDTTDTPFAIKKIQYVPLNPLTVLNKIRYDWSKTSRWALSSVNWVPAGENKPVLALPLAAAFITGVVALVTFGLGRGKTAGRILVPTIAVMWLCLELRWVSNLVVQAQDTVTSYSFIESTAHQLDYDSRVRDTVEQVLATEGTIDPATSTKRTILITAERLDLRYRMLRAKYHAAPSPALVLVNWSEQAARAGDELLMLPAAYAGDVERERDLQDFSSLLGQAGLALGKVERISGSAFAHVVPAADNARIGDSAASRIQK
jgi:hypothetical protein